MSRYMRWVMPLVDGALVFVSFIGGYYMRYQLQLLRVVDEANYAPFGPFIPYMLLFAAWIYFSLRGAGLYEQRRGRSWTEEMYSIVNATAGATVVTMAVSFFAQPLVFSRGLLLEAAALAIVLLGAARLVQRQVDSQLRARGVGVERVLIVGAGEIGRSVIQQIVGRPDLGYQAVGFVDDDPEAVKGDLGRVRALGGVDALAHLLVGLPVDLVVVTLPWQDYPKILKVVNWCTQRQIAVRVVPDLFQLSLSQVQVETLGGVPMLSIGHKRMMPLGTRLTKRALDLVVSVLALPVFLLIVAVVGLAIRLESPGPVFFTQERVGEGGRRFRVYKFRSMVADAETRRAELERYNEATGPLFKMRADPRITRVGRWMRRFSIDELPQMINVLRGEMSWIGPRPGLPEEVEQYEHWQRQRLEAPPGITGLWQVSGRSDVAFEEMCLMDIYYIENWSLGLDLQILVRTVPRALLGSGAY
ncbi:MAG: sugar transferase [Anaerolineae bacterium]|nr:sugar transferase [Anaerolineae bacterium]